MIQHFLAKDSSVNNLSRDYSYAPVIYLAFNNTDRVTADLNRSLRKLVENDDEQSDEKESIRHDGASKYFKEPSSLMETLQLCNDGTA